jgi:two-component system response regulator DegU
MVTGSKDLFQEGILHILKREAFISVVDDMKDLPDVILVNENLPKNDGVVMSEEIFENYPNAKMIIISYTNYKDHIKELLKHHVKGFLSKDIHSNTLLDAIKVVYEGGYYLDQVVLNHVINDYIELINSKKDTHSEAIIPFHLLTSREYDVLKAIADGQNNKEIARTLEISDKTVKNHVSNILEKFKVKDRTEALVKALQNNWVEIKKKSP